MRRIFAAELLLEFFFVTWGFRLRPSHLPAQNGEVGFEDRPGSARDRLSPMFLKLLNYVLDYLSASIAPESRKGG